MHSYRIKKRLSKSDVNVYYSVNTKIDVSRLGTEVVTSRSHVKSRGTQQSLYETLTRRRGWRYNNSRVVQTSTPPSWPPSYSSRTMVLTRLGRVPRTESKQGFDVCESYGFIWRQVNIDKKKKGLNEIEALKHIIKWSKPLYNLCVDFLIESIVSLFKMK